MYIHCENVVNTKSTELVSSYTLGIELNIYIYYSFKSRPISSYLRHSVAHCHK